MLKSGRRQVICFLLCMQDDTRDIFLDGIVARNRALNGDVVVVQILPQDQWKVGHTLIFLYNIILFCKG